MKYTIFLLTLLLFVPLYAQMSGYGVEYSRHLATQLNYNPQKPMDGTFQWGYLKTHGIGLFLQHSISKSFQVETKLKYAVKGTMERVQSLRVPGQFDTFFEMTLYNRFRYLNIDANIKYIIYEQSQIRLAPYIGFRNNFLLSYTLESDIRPINSVYPMKYYKKFKHFNIGMTLGMELFASNLISVSGETNWDLNSIVRSDILEVQNWLWSLNVGINLQKVIQPKIYQNLLKKHKSRLDARF